jgi:hypothetical protein
MAERKNYNVAYEVLLTGRIVLALSADEAADDALQGIELPDLLAGVKSRVRVSATATAPEPVDEELQKWLREINGGN